MRVLLSLISFMAIYNVFAAPPTIHGQDDRTIVSDKDNVKYSKAIAGIYTYYIDYPEESEIRKTSNGTYKINLGSFTKVKEGNVCSDHPFYKKETGPHCTAFLISKNTVMTAGHCLQNDGDFPIIRNREIDFELGIRISFTDKKKYFGE